MRTAAVAAAIAVLLLLIEGLALDAAPAPADPMAASLCAMIRDGINCPK